MTEYERALQKFFESGVAGNEESFCAGWTARDAEVAVVTKERDAARARSEGLRAALGHLTGCLANGADSPCEKPCAHFYCYGRRALATDAGREVQGD